MCLEDLRMGRKKYNAVHLVPCGSSVNTKLCTNSKDRVHLTLGVSQLSAAVAPGLGTMVSDDGLGVSGNFPALEIDIDTHGQVVQQEWYGRGIGATTTIMVIETFYKDDGPVT